VRNNTCLFTHLNIWVNHPNTTGKTNLTDRKNWTLRGSIAFRAEGRHFMLFCVGKVLSLIKTCASECVLSKELDAFRCFNLRPASELAAAAANSDTPNLHADGSSHCLLKILHPAHVDV
jgi:hypothetical protein